MAELPEIEALRRELEKDVAGRKIKTVDATALKPIRRYKTKKAFTALVEGRKVSGFERRGPFLLMKLDNTDALVIDLGPTGQLVRAKTARKTAAKGTQLVITFTQGGQLIMVDPKNEAEVWVAPLAELAAAPELAGLGLDPLEASMSWDDFGRLLYHRHGKLKALLTDRSVVVGIGPCYSDEILFAAGLRHDRASDALSAQEIRRLYRAMVETIQDAVKFRLSAAGAAASAKRNAGDPFDDEAFDHLKVWERDGDACRRCRHTVVKSRLGNRYTYYCEACQV